MAKIVFIGMGNMGKAILHGALKEFPRTDFVFSAKTEETKRKVFEELGVAAADSNAECANRCKYLILAVKPQFYDDVLNAIRYMVTPDHVIISLAPGITIASLKETLGSDRRIVRAMPNTPALIGEGMTMEEAMAEVKMVVEGVYSAKAARELAEKYEVSMPIVEKVNQVLFEGKPAKDAVSELMMRDGRSEYSNLPWD